MGTSAWVCMLYTKVYNLNNEVKCRSKLSIYFTCSIFQKRIRMGVESHGSFYSLDRFVYLSIVASLQRRLFPSELRVVVHVFARARVLTVIFCQVRITQRSSLYANHIYCLLRVSLDVYVLKMRSLPFSLSFSLFMTWCHSSFAARKRKPLSMLPQVAVTYRDKDRRWQLDHVVNIYIHNIYIHNIYFCKEMS